MRETNAYVTSFLTGSFKGRKRAPGQPLAKSCGVTKSFFITMNDMLIYDIDLGYRVLSIS